MSYDDFEYEYTDDEGDYDEGDYSEDEYDDSGGYDDGGDEGDYDEGDQGDSWESYYLADEGGDDDDDGRDRQEEQVAQAEQADQSWADFLAQFADPTEERGRPPAEQTWDQYLAQYAGDPAQDQAVFANQKTTETRVAPTETQGAPNEAVVTWADGSGMDAKTQKQARIYQVGLQEGLDAEGARVLVAVSETEGGLFGAVGDTNKNPLGSRGPFQFYEGGQMPAFRSWLRENNIAGDPNVLVNDVDLATRFAARTYLGRAIKLGQEQYGLHDYRLAEFVQENGQVSENPERTRESYLNLFYGRDARVAPFYDQAKGGLQDPFERALTVAVPKAGARAAANAQIPSGHYDGDGHDHGIATPYTQRQVDKSGQTWTVAFDYDQPYNNPFNPAIPNHRGVDVQMTGAANGGMGLPYTAFRDGTVVKITNDPHGGTGIIVDTGDPNARYDRYFHNNAVSVKEGERVTAGTTKMGILGQTGTEGFPHLHYEVSKNIDGDPSGQTIDPRPYLGGPVGPRRPVAGDTAAAPAAPRIIPMETPYTSGKRPQTTGVVIHATHGGAPTPEEEFAWTQRHFMNNPDQVSANAVIAADGTIAMPSDWDAVTHHAGENNSSMFGIELARARPGMPYTDAQYASLGWLLGEVSKRYNLPLTRQSVVGHEELAQGKRGGKIDPGPEFSFDRALAIARGAPPAPQAAAAPVPAPPPARRAISADADVRRAATTPAAAAQPKALPPETERALREWQGWRASRGESQTDLVEFRAHLGRLGAPDPWAADEQRNAEITRSNAENRTKFLAQLPEPTQRAYTEWEGFRKSRGEDPGDISAFRAHLDRLGAPNPWTQQEQEQARIAAHNAEVRRQNAALAAQPARSAAAAPTAGSVPMVDGKPATQAEYDAAVAHNAEVDRRRSQQRDLIGEQNRMVQEFNDRANAEQQALDDYGRRYQQWAADAEADPYGIGPEPIRPATPYLTQRLNGTAPKPIVGTDEAGYRQVGYAPAPEHRGAQTASETRQVEEINTRYGPYLQPGFQRPAMEIDPVTGDRGVPSIGPDGRPIPTVARGNLKPADFSPPIEIDPVTGERARATVSPTGEIYEPGQRILPPELQMAMGQEQVAVEAEKERRVQARLDAIQLERQQAIERGNLSVFEPPREGPVVNERIKQYYLDRGYSDEQATKEATIGQAQPGWQPTPEPPPLTPEEYAQQVAALRAEVGREYGEGKVSRRSLDILEKIEARDALREGRPVRPITVTVPAKPAVDAATGPENPIWTYLVDQGWAPGDATRETDRVARLEAQRPIGEAENPLWTYLVDQGLAPTEATREVARQQAISGIPATTVTLSRPEGTERPAWLAPYDTTIDPNIGTGYALSNAGSRGLYDFITGLDAAGEGVASTVGLTGAAGAIRASRMRLEEERRQRGIDVRSSAGPWDSPLALAETITETGVSVAPTILAGLMTGGGAFVGAHGLTGTAANLYRGGAAISRAGLGLNALSAYGQRRIDLEDEVARGELSPGVANIIAAGSGITEYLTERYVPGLDKAMVTGLGDDVARRFTADIKRRGLGHAVGWHMGQEIFQEGAEEGISESYGAVTDAVFTGEKPTLSEAIARIGTAAVLGGVMGGVTAAPVALAAGVTERSQERAETIARALANPDWTPDSSVVNWNVEQLSTPAKELAADGFQVTAVTPDWSRYNVVQTTPDGLQQRTFGIQIETDANGKPVGRVVEPYRGAIEAPLADTPENQRLAEANLGAVMDVMNEKAGLTDFRQNGAMRSMLELGQAVLASAQADTQAPVQAGQQDISSFDRDARPHQAMPNASSTAPIAGLDTSKPWAYKSPRAFVRGGVIRGTDVALYAADSLATDDVTKIMNAAAMPVLTKVLGEVVDRLDQRAGRASVLPSGIRRFLSIHLFGGGMNAMNSGTPGGVEPITDPVTGDLTYRDRATGRLVGPGAVAFDPPQLIFEAIDRATRANVSIMDPAFAEIMTDVVMESAAHEPGHDPAQAEDKRHVAAMTSFLKALQGERAAVAPVIHELHRSGALFELANLYGAALERGALNPNWRAHGAAVQRHIARSIEAARGGAGVDVPTAVGATAPRNSRERSANGRVLPGRGGVGGTVAPGDRTASVGGGTEQSAAAVSGVQPAVAPGSNLPRLQRGRNAAPPGPTTAQLARRASPEYQQAQLARVQAILQAETAADPVERAQVVADTRAQLGRILPVLSPASLSQLQAQLRTGGMASPVARQLISAEVARRERPGASAMEAQEPPALVQFDDRIAPAIGGQLMEQAEQIRQQQGRTDQPTSAPEQASLWDRLTGAPKAMADRLLKQFWHNTQRLTPTSNTISRALPSGRGVYVADPGSGVMSEMRTEFQQEVDEVAANPFIHELDAVLAPMFREMEASVMTRYGGATPASYGGIYINPGWQAVRIDSGLGVGLGIEHPPGQVFANPKWMLAQAEQGWLELNGSLLVTDEGLEFAARHLVGVMAHEAAHSQDAVGPPLRNRRGEVVAPHDAHGVAHSRLFERIYEDIGGDYVPQVAEILKRARDNGTLEQFDPDLVPSHGNWYVQPSKPDGWNEVGWVPNYPEGHLKPVPLFRATQAGRRPTTEVASQFTQGLDLVRAPGATGEGVLPNQPAVRLDPSQVLDREPPRQPPPPVQLREEWPEAFADMVEPGKGLPVPAFAGGTRSVEVDQRVPFGVAYHRLWTPEIAAIVRNNPGLQSDMGETYLKNPLLYEGADSVNDRASALMQVVGGTPEQGGALVSATQDALTVYGPTTENVESILAWVGLGDPTQAPLIVKAARGNTSPGAGGLVDLMVTHMLAHEARMAGYDGHVAYQPTQLGGLVARLTDIGRFEAYENQVDLARGGRGEEASQYETDENGRVVYRGPAETPPGYRFEDGRPTFQGVENPYQIEGNGLVYRPEGPSAMVGQEPPHLAAQRLQADLTHPELHADIAQRANGVLADWTQDEDGYDDVFGAGGVCDQISEQISGAIVERYDDIGIIDGGQDGDDHAYPIAYRNGAAFAVDIPPSVYETGGGYSWQKIPGATIEPSDVVVEEVPYEYLGVEEEYGPSAMVGQEPARLTGVPVELPSDPEFSRAVANTAGAAWTDEDGLEISLQRWQVPEQAEQISARTGVFYLPTARSRNPYRRGSQAGYGGTQRVTGSSFFRRPYAVRGATGGGAVARAYDQLVGRRGAYEAMRLDAIRSIPYSYRQDVSAGEREQAIADVLERYGGDPDMAYEILQNHNRGNLTMTAIVEHIAASELRRQGYDSMVAYSAFRGKPTISEIFDVREETYPDEEGRTELHPQYQPRWSEMAPSAMAAEEPPSLGLDPDIWEARPQAISSGETSRKQVPALMGDIPWQRGTINFDLGGGRWDDATIALRGEGVRNIVYDPSFQSEEERQAALRHAREHGGADTVTVANVLNVIAEPEVRQQVIQQARDILRPGGTAYFSVFPNKRNGVGEQTTKDGWQENRPLASYLPEIQQEFPDARLFPEGSRVGTRIEAPSPALAPGPSAMAAGEPPSLNIPGVTTSRATMRRESAAEDKIVESNKQIITESYSGNIAHIIGKELVQNGVDAQRESPGAVMKVAYFTDQRRIWAIDQGTGMPASVVENEFTEYQGTKKSAGASGGKGTAKTAILGRNDRVEVRTVARIDPREERRAERTAPRELSADVVKATSIVFHPRTNLLELSDDGGYSSFWSGVVNPDQMDMLLGPEIAQAVRQTRDAGGTHALYGDDLARAKEGAVAPRGPRLPDAVERAQIVSFETAGRDQLIVTDANGNYLIDEGGVTLPRMYELLSEDVAEALLARPDDGIGYRELSGGQLDAARASAAERMRMEQEALEDEDEDVGEPYYEETILWGNSDDYLRPSKGLQTATGPFGWVDEAIGRGELQGILTDPMTRTPWNQEQTERLREIETEIADIEANTSDGYGRTYEQEARYRELSDELYELEGGMGAPRTGTRISLVLEQDAAWPAPSHSAEYPTPIEKYMNEHIASNRVEGQTVQFVLDGVEYQGQPLNPKQVANTFVKTLTSDTWEIDLYASDEVQEQGSIQVDVQNNGLYQLSIRPYLNRPAVMPTRISANIRSKVGAKARGYPWSSDRTRLIAGAEEAIEEYVQGDLMNAVIAQEIAARQAALRDAIPLPDGDGKLFNVGRVEGQELADLQDLAKRPYLAIMNRHLTELHNRLSAMLDGHTWSYSNGATFERSSFGGFGLSSGWQGLNSTITSFDTDYNTPHLLLYDPWQLLMTAALHTRDQDVALADAIEGEVVAAESRPEQRPIDITDALLAWDPNEEMRVVWTEPDTGQMAGNTVTPQRMMTDLRTYQRMLDEEDSDRSEWMLQHAKAYIEGVQPTADAYLEQLTQWLVAQAVESGESIELVDPGDPVIRPRDPSSEAALNYYSNVPYSSTDALYRRIPSDERGVAEATDAEDRKYAQDRLDRAQRQYEFNRDVEERYWEHMLGAGFKPNFEVNNNMYEVSQEGLDYLATEARQYTSYAEQERKSDPNSSYVRSYESAARSYNEAVARVSRITGLTPTAANAPFGGGAIQSLQAAAEPGQEWNPLFLAALSRGILGTTQHEFGHNAQHGHGEGFSSFLGAIHAVTQLPEILAITDRMVQELAESGGLRAMAADLEQHSRIISTENIFEKVSVSEEIPDAERWADWPVDPRTPPTDREAVGGVEPLAGPLYRGGEAGRRALPGRVPGYGEGGGLQPSDAVYDRGAGGSEAANVVRPVPPVGGAVQGAGTTAGDLTNARLGRSPTLQAVAAESAATLQDTLEQALQDDPMFGLGPSVEDQRTMAGFARFYTSAVLGLAANDAERLDTIGLTAQQAEQERQRALDLLATPERQTALYEAEAAWATLHGPSEPVADGPSAMAGQEPPSLADPFFSPLLMHAASLPDIMEGVQEVRRPSRPDTERVVRPAARNPNRDKPAPGSGLIMRDDGAWVRPAQARPDVIAVAGQTPGEQALQMLEMAGAKADELAWTGLKDWLQKYEGPRLTRPEILDYLNNNQVRLEETVFGGPRETFIEPEQVQVRLVERDDLLDHHGNLVPTRVYEVSAPGVMTSDPIRFQAREASRDAWELYDDEDRLIDQYDSYQDIEEDLPAHGSDVLTLRALPREGYRPVRHGQPDLQLPGGINYREIILTFPQKVTPNEQVRIERTPRGFYQVAEYSAAGGFNGFVSAEYRDEAQAVDAREKYLAENWESSGAQPTFKNPSHFGGIPNIVVWVRFNERTDADGKRVLFIEEIQSDWHQQGRKKGYLGEENVEYWIREPGGFSGLPSFATAEEAQAYLDRLPESMRSRGLEVESRPKRAADAVPDAPWRATPAWTGLAFRRMVRWGAENGFERIAWTTGDQQNDRWSLARRISEVAYSGSDLRAWNHEGEEVVSETGVSRDRLPEYIGPELTERLLAQEPQGTLRRLTGQDLVVGGKPMRDFYDRILVEVAQELGEPWGVTPSTTLINAAPEDPMEQVPFGAVEGGTEVNSMDLPGTMARSAMEIGQPMFMAAQEPPSLEELRDAPAAMWYSNLSRLAADLDDEIEAIPEVRGPDRTIPDRIARPANKNRQKQPPAPQSGLTMLEDGTWIKPGETIPGPVEQEGRTSAESAVAQLRVDGAKDAEIAWAHLDQWARDQGDRTVTRQDIQEHLAERAITIEENVYGGEDVEIDLDIPRERDWDTVENEPEVMEEGYEDEDGEWVEPVYYGQDEEPEYTFQIRAGVRGSDRWDWIYDVRGSNDVGWYVTDEDGNTVSNDSGGSEHNGISSVERNVRAAAEELLGGEEGYGDTEGPAYWGPKSYPAYTLPGFDEYRELILRLPVAESPYRKIYAVQADIEDVNRRMREFLGNRPRDEAIRENVDNMDWLRQYAELSMEHGRLIEEHGQATRLRDESQFSESHWSQPNVVLHVRFTDRTLPSGEKLLFIEELQSDWQQQGRDRGFMPAQGLPEGWTLERRPPSWLDPKLSVYAGSGPIDQETGEYQNPTILEVGTPEHQAYLDENSNWYVVKADRSPLGPYADEASAIARARKEIGGLPEMPFDRAQLWATLGMRRMIRYAAENGFDKIGWTQGSVHDRRYPDPSRSSEAFKNFYDGRLVKVADELGEPYGVQSGYDEIDTGDMTHPSVGHDGDQFAVADGNGEIQPERFPTYQEAHAHMMANYEALTAGGERIHVMDLPEEMQRETLSAPQPMFMAAGEPPDLSGGQPVWDSEDNDWLNEIDPEAAALRDEYAARQEMTDPSGLPRTDTPIEAAALTAPETVLWDPEEGDLPADTAVLPDTPMLGPPDPREPNLDQFPDWAQEALGMGSLMTDATRTLSASDRAEIRDLVENGPQGTLLSEPEREVLIKTIEWQYQRLKRAANRRGPDGEMTPFRAAQLADHSRRYTALRALAATPRERWATLGDVWRSAPVSQGESGSLDEFQRQQREAAAAGDENAQAELERAAVRRLVDGIDSTRPRMVGRRLRRVAGQNVDADDRNQATEYGRGLQNAVDSSFASPNRVAAAVADTDLNLHPLEILQGMRYNAMLIGARGILTDYVSNIGMLFGKMMADTVIFEAGGFNPLARGTIAMAVTAAQARAVPLAMRSWSQTVLTGLSDAQADVGGTPRTMTDKLETRIQDAKSEGARWYGRRRLELTAKKTAALGFVELAQRFKGAADEGIKLVAYTGAMTRQAATLAWKKNDHPLNSEAWHAQVAEMMQGNGLHDDPKMNLAMYQQWVRNATREAEDTVFQGPMGAIGRMMEPIQKHPLGQFVLPFLRTLYHIRGLAVDVSPLGLPLAVGDVARAGVYRGLMRSERGQRALGATRNGLGLLGGPYAQAWTGADVGPGVRRLDHRMLAGAVGQVAFFYLVGLAFEGILSGVGPPDDPVVWLEEDKPNFERIGWRRSMEKEGWQRYSIKVNGQWISYQNWGPLAYLMASAAAIGEAYRYGVPADRRRSHADRSAFGPLAGLEGTMDLLMQGDQDTFKSAGRRFFSVAKDVSFLGGLIELADVLEKVAQKQGIRGPSEIETPNERLERMERADATINRWLGDIATTFVPVGAALRATAASQDPYMRSTEYGGFKDQFALMFPQLGGVIPPDIAPPWSVSDLAADEFGSTTGRRQGLPLARDILGEPIANQYQGWSAWMPWRAKPEDLSSPVTRALIEAEMGPPTAHSEMYYQPIDPETGKKAHAIMIQLPPSIRSELADTMGHRIDARLQKEMAEVSPAQRAADPDAWKKRMADAMWQERRGTADDWVADPKNLPTIRALMNDDQGARIRWFESKADKNAIRGGAALEEGDEPGTTSTPNLGPPVATPQPRTTPRPGTPTPGPGRTPTPRATPMPPVPGQKSQQEIDRDRLRGTPVPAGR